MDIFCPAQASELSEAVMFGVPHLLLPSDEALEDMAAAEDNHKMLAALCQVRLLQPSVSRRAAGPLPCQRHADLWL